MIAVNERISEWKAIPWRKLEREVFRLQRRIYEAAQGGDKQTVRKLQRLLVKSWSAKCLAVRRVTQDNQGKKTASVDSVKSLTPKQRLELVGQLKISNKAKLARIPKPGREEKRSLAIPIMYDRALQELVKQALEPEWEAYFEANSYGFRPGRGYQDAMAAIFQSINRKPKWVLDADLAKCFDKIDRDALLTKLNTLSIFRRQIRAWLIAGVIDAGEMFETLEGTGGVISPLLVNVALHGLEEKVKDIAGKVNERIALMVVRYAGKFIILHENREVIEKAQKVVTEWLKEIGLELKHEKTNITHTLQGEKPGFDFLGFNVRQYEVSRYRTGKNASGEPLGFKTIIKPSNKSIKKHKEKLAEIITNHRAAPQAVIISRLNPIIREWVNYFRTGSSKETCSDMDHYLWTILWRWAKRRHSNKSRDWIAKKYWSTNQDGKWRFWCQVDGRELELLKHTSVEIVRHVKVEGKASPYDGNFKYWSTRLGKNMVDFVPTDDC